MNMKLRLLLLVSLTLALVGTASMPTRAQGAAPQYFGTSGTISSISDPVEFPAGQSGRFVVVDRQVTGTLLAGDITGDFVMTYRANVELATQAGNLHGTLEVGPYVFEVNGKIHPWQLVPVPGVPVQLPKLSLSGEWALTEGTSGQGKFDAWIVFIPDAQGHVAAILGSSFTITGKWQQ